MLETESLRATNTQNSNETNNNPIETEKNLERLLTEILDTLSELIELKQLGQQPNERYKGNIEYIINLILNFLTKFTSSNEDIKDLLETTKQVLEFSVLTHLEFDSLWAKPSFHNEIHVLAVICAFLKALFALPNNQDIFQIQNNLIERNRTCESSESYPDPIALNEFALAVVMALATHDLGNILQEIKQPEERKPKPIFHRTYNAKNAETRSQQIASTLIKKFSSKTADQAKIQQIIKLVQYLIKQTEFEQNPDLTKERLWWLLIQIIDQIGGNVILLKHSNTNYYVIAVAGLIGEICVQDSSIPINLESFLKFVPNRLQVLTQNIIQTDPDFPQKVLILLLSTDPSCSPNDLNLNLSLIHI